MSRNNHTTSTADFNVCLFFVRQVISYDGKVGFSFLISFPTWHCVVVQARSASFVSLDQEIVSRFCNAGISRPLSKPQIRNKGGFSLYLFVISPTHFASFPHQFASFPHQICFVSPKKCFISPTVRCISPTKCFISPRVCCISLCNVVSRCQKIFYQIF